MMQYGDYDGVGWMLGGGLMMVLFWIGPIALVVWGLGGLRGGQRPTTHDETPLEILRRRYASGEISDEEFEQARRTLG
jgi:putative membrane protein